MPEPPHYISGVDYSLEASRIQQMFDQLYAWVGALGLLNAGSEMGMLPGSVKLIGISVGTTEAAVEHGIGDVPLGFLVVGDTCDNLRKSKASDGRNIYLIADAAGEVDLIVLPQQGGG